ncbi:Uncharacterized protein FWK35_00034121, partial [Aphis craccivora]
NSINDQRVDAQVRITLSAGSYVYAHAAARHQQVWRHKRTRDGENASLHGDHRHTRRMVAGGRHHSRTGGTSRQSSCTCTRACLPLYKLHQTGRSGARVYTEHPPLQSPTTPTIPIITTTPHSHYTPVITAFADATTTTLDDRGFRYRIVAAPPDGLASDCVTGAVRHTTTARRHRHCIVLFADTTSTDIILVVVVVVVLQSSTQCSLHLIAATASGSNIFWFAVVPLQGEC